MKIGRGMLTRGEQLRGTCETGGFMLEAEGLAYEAHGQGEAVLFIDGALVAGTFLPQLTRLCSRINFPPTDPLELSSRKHRYRNPERPLVLPIRTSTWASAHP